MPKRILVIDDDEDILDILNIVLQEEGFEVVISNTPNAAEHIDHIKPHLVLLDVRIAGSDRSGAEICKEIKLRYALKPLPVMLISAETDLHAISAGCQADAFVRKPFDIDDLVTCVRTLLN